MDELDKRTGPTVPENEPPGGGRGGSLPGAVPAPAAAGDAGEARASELGFLAHEIRNPLSTALWTAELLERLPAEERGGDRGARLAAICLRSVGRVRLLVEDHLLMERLAVDGLPLRAEPVPLVEALDEVLARRPAEPAPVELAVAPELVAQVDRALLLRLLEGVVAGAAGGAERVAVSAIRAGDRLEIRVRGAPPGSLEPPRRGAPSEPRGRALSLAAAVRAAAAIGGSLAVDGEAYLVSIPAT